jgi:hypothetical protein
MDEILSAIFTTLSDVFISPPFRKSDKKWVNVVVGILWFLFCFTIMIAIIVGVYWVVSLFRAK